MSLDIILGGLVGSILTVIVTKVFDLIQEGRRHKYSLQKAFFEKKLKVIESAVIQWYSVASALGGAAALYEQVTSEDYELAPDVFLSVNNHFVKQLKNAFESTEKLSNAVLLYLDVDDWNYELFKEYLESWSKAEIYNSRIQAAMDYYKEQKGTDNKQSAWEKLIEVNKEFKEVFDGMTSVLNKIHQDLVNTMNKARGEMKKYEC